MEKITLLMTRFTAQCVWANIVLYEHEENKKNKPL